MTPGERKRFEAYYSRWAAAFYITFALAMAAVLAMMLTGCAEAHTIPPADAGTCTDPHSDCVAFECPADESIGWHYPHGCDNPQLLEYAECNWWLRHGTPCGSGGTCAMEYTGLCEGER